MLNITLNCLQNKGMGILGEALLTEKIAAKSQYWMSVNVAQVMARKISKMMLKLFYFLVIARLPRQIIQEGRHK